MSVSEYNVRLCPDPGPPTPLAKIKKKLKTNSGSALNIVKKVPSVKREPNVKKEYSVKNEPDL